jgi:hypothetical protein
LTNEVVEFVQLAGDRKKMIQKWQQLAKFFKKIQW